ncbi:hypothetical protein PI124_g10442 [Phytophthora idaei]|nr:hypothetical protein PI126_g13867 [Phytophthora idaei]KAG3244793.1 hypothetical protein PI124_g10442 [Phytophthora idaei]
MEAAYAVRKLIDRHGEPTHVAYLAEWKDCERMNDG